MRRIAVVVAVFALGVGLPQAGCQSGAPAGEGLSAESITGEWVLREFEGDAVASGLLAASSPPTLAISSDGSVSGFGGVNRLSSRVDMAKLSRGEFSLGPIAATRMAGSAEAMQLESRFTRALEAARSCRRDGKSLLLLPSCKGTTLRFVNGA